MSIECLIKQNSRYIVNQIISLYILALCSKICITACINRMPKLGNITYYKDTRKS